MEKHQDILHNLHYNVIKHANTSKCEWRDSYKLCYWSLSGLLINKNALIHTLEVKLVNDVFIWVYLKTESLKTTKCIFNVINYK